MRVNENTLVGEFVNVIHKYGHGSGLLTSQCKDYYNVVIGKSSGLYFDEITIHFQRGDVGSILTGPDVTVIMLKETK